MASFAELLQTMCSLVTTVELDWAASSLSSVTNENDIGQYANEHATSLANHLTASAGLT